uniref:Minor capsid protein P9 transmembrane helices domain-containing protein n=1 Tax=viral metagenome TaxID=1070528 RepID=A0A6C0DQB4_9ZZZZ
MYKISRFHFYYPGIDPQIDLGNNRIATNNILFLLYNNILELNMNNREPDTIPFWSNNPNVLFQPEYIFEFFPIDSMTYEQKLNAITRSVIVLTIISFAASHNIRSLIISGITIFAIFLLYYYHEQENLKKDSKKASLENFTMFGDPGIDFLNQNSVAITSDAFDKPTTLNPFSNVLNSDIDYNPNKKPAPPAFNANVNATILANAKQLISNANPDQPDIADKLFRDLGDQLVFEQSLRQFNSNPNTTIPNDQGAFADFCYGNMVSCKEGNNFACARNLSRYQNV